MYKMIMKELEKLGRKATKYISKTEVTATTASISSSFINFFCIQGIENWKNSIMLAIIKATHQAALPTGLTEVTLLLQ